MALHVLLEDVALGLSVLLAGTTIDSADERYAQLVNASGPLLAHDPGMDPWIAGYQLQRRVLSGAYVSLTAWLAAGGFVGGAGSGDVVGTTPSLVDQIPRYQSVSGKRIKNSLVTISDAGSISLPAAQTVDGRDVSADGAALDAHVANVANPHATTLAQVGGVIGVNIQGWSDELDGLAALVANGLVSRTANGTYAPRTLAAPASGITIANPGGVAGDPTFALANDLAALEGMAGTGLVTRTAAETYAQRSIIAPAAGITIADGGGVAGNPTLALANDLAAVEGLATTGAVRRTAADTWAAGVLPVADGGTALAALGSAYQVLRTNSAANALEYYMPPRTLVHGKPAGDTLSFAVSAAEQAYASFIRVPANTLVAGTVVNLFWHTLATTHGSNTRFRVRLGGVSGTVLVDTGSIAVSTVTAQNLLYYFQLMGTAAAGGAVDVEIGWPRAPGVGQANAIAQPIAIPTDADMDLYLTFQLAAPGATSFQCTGYDAQWSPYQ